MNRLILLLALFCAPLFAATVTLSGTGGNACSFAGSTSDRGGNVVYQCVGVLTPVPQPAPVAPRVEQTPPPAPAPAATGCVGMPSEPRQIASWGASALHRGVADVIYSYDLPRGRFSGNYGSGSLQQGDHPETPTEMTVEWSISRCRGDMNYYKSEAAAVMSGRGGLAHPCGGVNGAVGGSYYWSLAGSGYECKVDNAGPWYINVRYVNGCPPGRDCPVSYYQVER